MRRIWKICAWLLFLAFPFSAHAQESSLLLYPSSQEISVGEEFSVEIVGKELSNIAGGDIVVVYDKERLQLLSKQLLLSQEEILDLQKMKAYKKCRMKKIDQIFICTAEKCRTAQRREKGWGLSDFRH